MKLLATLATSFGLALPLPVAGEPLLLSEVLSTGSARVLARFLDTEGATTPPFGEIKDGPVKQDYFNVQAFEKAKTVARACHKDVSGGMPMLKAANTHKLTHAVSGWSPSRSG